MNCKYLTNEEIKNFLNKSNNQVINFDYYTKPLFHGTREYALLCSKDEIVTFLKSCHIIINFMSTYLVNLDEAKVASYRKEKIINGKESLFCGTFVRLYSQTYFDNDVFYLTTGYFGAVKFSQSAGGEIGEVAYHNAIGIRDFGIEVSCEVDDATKYILQEYPKFIRSKRVVLLFENVLLNDLLSENGNPKFIPTNYNFMENMIDEYECYEEDNRKIRHTYRLLNLEKYTPYVIKEEQMYLALQVFTKISRFGDLTSLLNANIA